MLYDPEREKKQLFELGKPSLKALSYALRHPETWPVEFYWDFTYCDHCAMGLASSLWGQIRVYPIKDASIAVSDAARLFAMSYEDADDLFLGSGDWAPRKIKIKTGVLGKLLPQWFPPQITVTDKIKHKAITPEMVADQIDKYLTGE